jgi:hypothetical protein
MKSLRFALLASCFSLIISPAYSSSAVAPPPMEQKGPSPQKRAYFALEVFVNGCFKTGDDEAALVSYMGSDFSSVSAKSTLMAYALDATKAKEGKLWGANFPQGQIAILLDSDNNCHTLVYGGDPATLHQGMKDMKDYRKEDPRATYTYKPRDIQDPSSRDESTVTINTKESGPVQINLTTTPGSANDLTGVITVIRKPAAAQ